MREDYKLLMYRELHAKVKYMVERPETERDKLWDEVIEFAIDNELYTEEIWDDQGENIIGLQVEDEYYLFPEYAEQV